MAIQTAPARSQKPSATTAWIDALADARAEARQDWYGKLLCRLGLHTGVWVYIDEGSCSQLRACRRCGKGDVRIRHVKRWRYTRRSACDQTKICARCGERGRQRTRHEWGPTYTVDSGHNGRRCSRCSEERQWSTTSDD